MSPARLSAGLPDIGHGPRPRLLCSSGPVLAAVLVAVLGLGLTGLGLHLVGQQPAAAAPNLGTAAAVSGRVPCAHLLPPVRSGDRLTRHRSPPPYLHRASSCCPANTCRRPS